MRINLNPFQWRANAELAPENREVNAEDPELSLPFWRQLRSTLTLSFVFLVVLSVIVVLVVALTQMNLQTQKQAKHQLESIAELKHNEIVRWLEDSQAVLELFLATPNQRAALIALADAGMTGVERNSLNSLFEQTAKAHPFFEEIFLYDIHGHILGSSDPIQIGKLVTTQPYFRNSLVRNYIQSPYYRTDKDTLTMVVTHPLIDQGRGQTVGVLVGRLDLSTLEQIMTQRSGLGESGETYLVSIENNNFLTPSHFSGYPLAHAYHSEAIDQVLAGEDGSAMYEDYRNPPVTVFGAYRWIPELQAGLVAKIDRAEALAAFSQALSLSIIVTIMTILLAGVVGFYRVSRISEPIMGVTRAVTRVTVGDINQRVEIPERNEIGLLAHAFNTMTQHLRNLIDSLEVRIHERTHALEISADISSQMAAILDLEELLKYLVNRIQKEFDFYHTHIYLIEEDSEDLVMVEGFGEVGRKLKEQGHRLPAGQGIVGTVASTNEPFRSNNVADVLNFVQNPLLPNTRSELAVPLRKGDRVLGVLDIQSEQVNRFAPSDLSLMQAIANQIAIAIDNARLLTQTQIAFEEVEYLNQRLTGEVWEKISQEYLTTGYHYNHGVSVPITPDRAVWLPPMTQAVTTRQVIKQIQPGNGEGPKAELAIPLILRGQVIGALGIKREEASAWSEDEVLAVEAVANQIALALENARLSEEQEKTIVQLKDVDRLKSEFLTSMSHELRTPLNSIIGFADVLLQGIDGELNEMALNDVRLIHNSGQHLLALINDILDLSKIEAGKMELVCEPLSVVDALHEVLAASSALLKKKPVEVIIEADESLSPVYADKLRFNQILLNLVSNAAKFTEQGSISLKAQTYESDPDKILISVADTGIGIAVDKLDAIFDRFRQADSSTTRQYGGSGLGLPICKQLIEMHGGEIWITSEEGVGSTFWFTIPIDKPASDELGETAGVIS